MKKVTLLASRKKDRHQDRKTRAHSPVLADWSAMRADGIGLDSLLCILDDAAKALPELREVAVQQENTEA